MRGTRAFVLQECLEGRDIDIETVKRDDAFNAGQVPKTCTFASN